MGLSIGIDLGTTNAAAAVIQGSRPKTIQLSGPDGKIRCAVHVKKDGQLLVGSKAYDRARSEPDCTAIAIKRLVGARFDRETVQLVRDRFGYEIAKDPDGPGVRVALRGMYFSPCELLALILKKVKEDSEARLGQEVTEAVIAIPAYFDETQANDTRMAGEMAGLLVKSLIPEPTAAVIAFNLKHAAALGETYVVYDLGGGTFDATVVEIREKTYILRGLSGLTWLGGDDFDNTIADYCGTELNANYGLDLNTDKSALFKLRQMAEFAKKQLDRKLITTIEPSKLTRFPQNVSSTPLLVTRDQLDQWTKPTIAKTIEATAEAISNLGLSAREIERVLLVGSSTAAPIVRNLLTAYFEDSKICYDAGPSTCVAVGAANIAAGFPEAPRVLKANSDSLNDKRVGHKPLEVFISAKSSDYHFATQVYEFLTLKGVKAFLSSESLPALGNSDYRKEIDRALDEAQHMVVVTSSKQNVESPWVEAEWGFFINEKRSGRKRGNLVVVLASGLTPPHLPPSLRYYEALNLDAAGLEKLLSYVKPQSIRPA